jgi:hypothetical protein
MCQEIQIFAFVFISTIITIIIINALVLPAVRNLPFVLLSCCPATDTYSLKYCQIREIKHKNIIKCKGKEKRSKAVSFRM